jgi:cytochrome c oxidase cbb3-type subunit 3
MGRRWGSTTTVALGLILSASGLPIARAADVAGAKQNYDRFCAVCHGKTGKGDGPGGLTLSTHPRDFTDCARMKTMTDETLFTAIKEGGPAVNLSKDMQSWKDGMDDDEIHALVAYVHTFCQQ